LFSDELKRPLPMFPRRIGIVTSPSAAAFADVQHVLRRRYPLAEVILSPTPVQGDDAPPQIVAALRRFETVDVDVILLIRGGGSLEDLWCFNHESIARAIRMSRVPVVTGVGHETDTTLVDGAADRRAPTPSAGAELITPHMDDLRMRLRDMMNRATDAVFACVDDRREMLDDAAHKLRLVSPAARVRNNMQRLDDLGERMNRAMRQRIAAHRRELAGQARALELANPSRLLSKGYAIVTRPLDGKRITRAAEAGNGTTLDVQLSQGRLTVRVMDRKLSSESDE
jgi:exodeoxyribonuclease VII large subunit